MATSRDLTTGSISGHFAALAIPTAIGMVFTTLYNVVDVFWAGRLSTEAQAGLAISFQVFFILIVMAFGMSAAMGALVGNALGAGDDERAGRVARQGLLFSTFASLAVMVIGYLVSPYLLAIISEPGAYRDAANAYVQIIMLGAPLFIIAQTANGILTAQGDTKTMQYAQIGSFFANVTLNPLFIFGVPGVIGGLGFNGIALSTLVSQAGTLAFVLWRARRSDVMQDVPWKWQPNWETWRNILAQALPISFAMMVMMLAGFVVQYFLKGFGGEAVAAYGVALRIEQLLLLPAFGLTGALLPIAAQNFGANNPDRVRAAAFFCFKAGVGLMLGGSALLWFAAPPMMRIFTPDPEVVRIGTQYLHVDGFILPIYVMLFAINSLLQAFKQALWTLWISIYRQGIAVFAFAWFFVEIFGMGTFGVWIGIATAVVTGFLVSLAVVEHVARREIGGLFVRRPGDAAGA